MSRNLAEQLQILPANLANHLLITVIPLLIGIGVSLPLAVLVVKHPKLRYPTLTAVSVIQTIPSLALLALMVPVLVGISALTARLAGVEISALGFYPTVIALTLYSMLPVVRNAVTGILGVEPALTEAARGVGMTPRQVLWKVELPLAAPVIIAGIRTATVWVVGIATLATPVGQRCLGNFIFRGLQTRNWTAVLVGCVAAAALAMLLDLLIGGIERGVKDRRRPLSLGSGLVLLAVVIAGLIAPQVIRSAPLQTDASAARRVADSDAPDSPAEQQEPVRIGAKTFTEQYILAAAIQQILSDAGVKTVRAESLGSTVAFDALAAGELDVYVDYSGTIWANHMGRGRAPAPWKVLAIMSGWLADQHGIRCLGSLGFENAYALAMRRDQAETLGINDLHDLAKHAPEMTIGGDYEFFGRPEWRQIRETYGLSFRERTSYDSTFMYSAVAEGEVDVISAFSSDGRIAAFDLAVLDDPEGAIPPYDAVLLLSPQAAARPGVVSALLPMVDSVPIERMRRANLMVDREADKRTVGEAADWLLKGLNAR